MRTFILVSLFFLPCFAFASLPPVGFGTITDWQCIKGQDVKCVAVGYKETKQQNFPLLVTTIDGGAHWTEQTISGNVPTNSKLDMVSCDWDGSFCVVTGEFTPKGFFLVQSDDFLASWHAKDFPDSDFEYKYVRATSCTGDTDGSLCIITGINDLNPFIYHTKDKGKSWQRAGFGTSTSLTKKAHLRSDEYFWDITSASCAGNKDTASCIVYWHQWDAAMGTYILLYFASYDGGKSWGNYDQ